MGLGSMGLATLASETLAVIINHVDAYRYLLHTSVHHPSTSPTSSSRLDHKFNMCGLSYQVLSTTLRACPYGAGVAATYSSVLVYGSPHCREHLQEQLYAQRYIIS